MPILTDDEARALATLCPPHKIIIDGNGLKATIDSACIIAHTVEDLIQATPELKQLAFDVAMTMHEMERRLEPMVKKLVMRAAQIEYGKP